MRVGLLLLGLWACDGGGPGPDDTATARNGLGVSFDVTEVPDELFSLSLRVEQVVLEGQGPAGPASVSTEVGRTVALVGGDGGRAGIVLDLPIGAWSDVTLQVHLAARDGEPALAATGQVEQHRFELEVAPVLVFSDHGSFELGAGVDPEVVFVLDPEEWLGGLEDVEAEDEETVVRIDLTHNREAYDEIVADLVDSTTARFPGEEEPRESSR